MFRRMSTAEFRLQATTGNNVVGHASVFNRLADIGRFYEEIAPTAFDEVLAGSPDVPFLMNHNADNLLGRTTSGTLALGTDAEGLVLNNELPQTSLGADVRVLVDRKDLTGFSFGYVPDEGSDTYRTAPDGKKIVTRNNVQRLLDVSIVTYPAYLDANDAQLRSIAFDGGRLITRRSQLIRVRSRLNSKGK